MNKLSEWKHVFKLDPQKTLSDHDLQLILESGTDAVIIGGTDGVTFENVSDLFDRVQPYDVPCLLEVSDIEVIAPEFDGYLIPMVLNSREKKWMLDIHHQAVKEYGDIMDWDQMVVEGYCVLNEKAKVFKHANCYLPDEEDVLAYARMAEHMFHLPVFYLEYSGTYGDPELVKKITNELQHTTVVYGGGIRSSKQAEEMSACADVIVVGNVLYEDLDAALKTVSVAKKSNF
ncbi:putative glycerol-1-phosphate prenyltransferase [Halobacillus alkaliphilus]|uniref:Heptaprenylglyceryl phosphate synthase n=1 Tax=Halobacillus alkaliphilus TaxID=396056 RepID=A0A1I2M0R4_9BACI|nr:heptaprenylglyceryl phosphate synthase [Halobacillus alkaliphilus]SFF85192.1 putative glycerol-1-phosphate prenyltransferase [Halobacillus alkaliphilus]